MKRTELVNHFKEKYKDNSFILESIQKKSTEELNKIYKLETLRKKRERKILENGSRTYTIDFDIDIKEAIEKYMWDAGMFTMFNGEINYSCKNDGRLLGVPVQFIDELKKVFDIRTSREMYILGKNDINKFNVGDKVKITTSGIFGISDSQGTVYSVSGDEIVIRKYRSRSKGFTLYVGDECKIEKIKQFQKVS